MAGGDGGHHAVVASTQELANLDPNACVVETLHTPMVGPMCMHGCRNGDVYLIV